MPINAALRRRVRKRAGNRCEYCRCHQDELPFVTFHVEHIIARQHGGSDSALNLCLACHWCNFHKGTNIATRVDAQLVPLFHPRQHLWNEHFATEGDTVIGLTAIGRGTVRLLDMNSDERRELRRLCGR
jgi:hypothetical protein